VNQGPSAYLVLQADSGTRRFALVEGKCWTVGRGEESNIVIKDRCISRNHAMLQSTEGGYYLIDMGSSNGTFVNGRRVSVPLIIHDGDTVTFGQTELKFFRPRIDEASLGNADEMTLDGTVTSILHVRKLMSVMVVDMRNYTVLARQTEENILSEVMTTWFRNAGHIIRRYGSWVDKYIGDAVMALWFHNSDTVTKQEMMGILHALNDIDRMTKALSKRYPLPFELRVGAGLNTGYGMVGNAGSSSQPDYTALGDTVNSAFRLESITKEIGAEIAIGVETYQYVLPLIGDNKVFKQCSVQLKGYEQPAITYATKFSALNTFLSLSGDKPQPKIKKTAPVTAQMKSIDQGAVSKPQSLD
jgi:adenylate cyclase